MRLINNKVILLEKNLKIIQRKPYGIDIS